MSGSRRPVTGEIRDAIRDFLYEESAALDERRFRDWLSFFAPDARYEMPVRVTREGLVPLPPTFAS